MFANRKNIIRALIVGIVAFIVLSSWYYFATSQELTITTNDKDATISIQPGNGGAAKELGKGSVTTRLALGDYSLRAQNGSKETRGIASLKGGDKVTVTLALSEVRTPQKLHDGVGRAPIASAGSVQYLNPVFGQLETYVFAESDSRPFSNLFGLTGVIWATPTSGLTVDETGSYSYVDSQTDTPLDLDNSASATVNAAGTLAYAHGKKVLVRTIPAGETSYSIGIAALDPELVLGDKNRLLVYDAGIDSEGDSRPAAPVLYEGATKLDAATSAISMLQITGARWSPNGQLLAISASTGSYLLDIPSAQLTRLSVTNAPHSNSFTWVTDDSLLYFTDQIIWRINTKENTWQKLALVDESVDTSSPFAISPDGQNVFFFTDLAESGGMSGKLYTFSLR